MCQARSKCFPYTDSFGPHHSHVGGPIIIFSVQKRKARHRESKQLVQDYTASRGKAGVKSRQSSPRAHKKTTMVMQEGNPRQ